MRHHRTENTPDERRIDLRPVSPEDEAVVYEVYAGVRGEELAACGWSGEQQTVFLKMQLKARDQSYLMFYPGLDDQVILLNEKSVGRLIVSRTEDQIRLVDIAILPQHRETGIGTAVMKGLLKEAEGTKRPLRLQVEKTNPQALTLYERLGFSVTGENQTHTQMEWTREGMSAEG